MDPSQATFLSKLYSNLILFLFTPEQSGQLKRRENQSLDTSIRSARIAVRARVSDLIKSVQADECELQAALQITRMKKVFLIEESCEEKPKYEQQRCILGNQVWYPGYPPP